jgi:nitrite reductase/ring-hydroxylating ferredoxin subunit
MTTESDAEIVFETVGKVSDFPENELKLFKFPGCQEVVVTQVEGEFYGYSDYCTHAAAPMSHGWVNEGQIICPSHYACFAIKTGEVLQGPAWSPLPMFAVRVVGDEVQVEKRPLPQRPAHLGFVSPPPSST